MRSRFPDQRDKRRKVVARRCRCGPYLGRSKARRRHDEDRGRKQSGDPSNSVVSRWIGTHHRTLSGNTQPPRGWSLRLRETSMNRIEPVRSMIVRPNGLDERHWPHDSQDHCKAHKRAPNRRRRCVVNYSAKSRKATEHQLHAEGAVREVLDERLVLTCLPMTALRVWFRVGVHPVAGFPAVKK